MSVEVRLSISKYRHIDALGVGISSSHSGHACHDLVKKSARGGFREFLDTGRVLVKLHNHSPWESRIAIYSSGRQTQFH